MSAETPRLDAELERFGQDLLASAAAAPKRQLPRRRLVVAVALAVLLLVPGAIAAVRELFINDDRPMLEPPPGYTVPAVSGAPVEVASGDTKLGPWHAYAVRCGSGVSIVVVQPDGTRNSAACGAVPAGGGRPAPAAFAPGTSYDGLSQTTWIYAAVPATVAAISLDLSGRDKDGSITLPGGGPSHHEIEPRSVPRAAATLERDVKFVVLAVPGDQRVTAATARDSSGRVVSRCDGTSCENTG